MSETNHVELLSSSSEDAVAPNVDIDIQFKSSSSFCPSSSSHDNEIDTSSLSPSSTSSHGNESADKRKNELIIILNTHLTNVSTWHILDDYKKLYDQWMIDGQITRDKKDDIIKSLWERLDDNKATLCSMHQPKKEPFGN